MKNAYHRDIMTELISRGSDGMRIYQIARCIYNRHCGLFEKEVDYESIYKSISFYLWSQSKLSRSPFVRQGRGKYALKSDIAIQLDLFEDIPFDGTNRNKTNDQQSHSPKTDAVQLYLFDMNQF